jgi:hypothetical protein
LDRRVAELEARVGRLEDLIRRLTTALEADVRSLKITDAEVARQGQHLSPDKRWPSL